jgi:hypothetical protein
MAFTISDAVTQHWVGKALTLSNLRSLKRAPGAALNREGAKLLISLIEKITRKIPELNRDKATFRVGAKDAPFLERIMAGFSARDLQNQTNHRAAVQGTVGARCQCKPSWTGKTSTKIVCQTARLYQPA